MGHRRLSGDGGGGLHPKLQHDRLATRASRVAGDQRSSADMNNSLRNSALVLILLLMCGFGFAQQLQVTLPDFKGNNTSAASITNGSGDQVPGSRAVARVGVQNGVPGFDFGAVSKVPIRSLLGSGSGVRIYAHLMPWFGTRGHIDVGYDSAKTDQVRRQVEDMLSRGIDGAILYWTGASGSGNSGHTNEVAIKLMKEAERQAGFEFAIQEDKQALAECSKRHCNFTAALAGDLQYAARTFFASPAYMRMNGRPVLFFFGLEAYKNSIDWDRVRRSVPGNPLFVFRNSGASTTPKAMARLPGTPSISLMPAI